MTIGAVGQRHMAVAHGSGIHAGGGQKGPRNYELYDEGALGPSPDDWHTRAGRVVLTGEYGGKAGFRHVMDGLGVAGPDEDLTFNPRQPFNTPTPPPLPRPQLRCPPPSPPP